MSQNLHGDSVAVKVRWVPKNSSQRFRLALKEHNGAQFADLRLYFRTSSDDEFKPTKKGLAVTLKHWRPFVAAVRALDADLIAAGLVSADEGTPA